MIDIVRLAVEAALAENVADLAVEPRHIAEDAGVGQADETEVGRKVEFDAINLAVTDIPRLVDKGASTFRSLFCGVHQFDAVAHVAKEELDGSDAGPAAAASEAEVDATYRSVLGERVAEQAAVDDCLYDTRGRVMV